MVAAVVEAVVVEWDVEEIEVDVGLVDLAMDAEADVVEEEED